MDYIEYKLNFAMTPEGEIAKDIAVAELAEMGFDSFDEETTYLRAYITEGEFALYSAQIEEYIKALEGVEVEISKVETINWNKEWESNFDPIDIDGICTIRAPFHEKTNAKFEIEIMPKMSFGTGHHATTFLMVHSILNSNLNGLKGLDMGSGTGVLAIAALKNGASKMDCVDIDEWAYENCIENCAANGVGADVDVILGDASAIEGRKYDFILANINRNILINDMARYVATLNDGGELRMSGFLEIDIEDIVEKGNEAGLKEVSHNLKDGWATLLMKKI